MEALKHQSQEVWQSYIRTVEHEGMIEGQTYNTILRTASAERNTREIVDLLRRMLDMVRGELGMDNGEAR